MSADAPVSTTMWTGTPFICTGSGVAGGGGGLLGLEPPPFVNYSVHTNLPSLISYSPRLLTIATRCLLMSKFMSVRTPTITVWSESGTVLLN